MLIKISTRAIGVFKNTNLSRIFTREIRTKIMIFSIIQTVRIYKHDSTFSAKQSTKRL